MSAVRVLVVDDSAVVRQAMTALLGREMSVTTAADPLIAMMRMEMSRPDVIVLDLEMPRMDGLTFLRQLMRDSPLPVVVCSSLTAASSELTIRALQLGAVDVVQKPKIVMGAATDQAAEALIETIRGAAEARVGRHAAHAPRVVPIPRVVSHALTGRPCHVVVAGASTGGTEVLRSFLDAMPADAPPIVIVQHMPEQFTTAFARRLNETSAMEVREARAGDVLRPGLALVAPGDRHLTIARQGVHGFTVMLDAAPPVNRHRPSVDVLFSSAARSLGRAAIGVLMTGMGRDGAKGLLQMKTAGAFTLAQDEATSVVFGMPRAAIEMNAVTQVAAASDLAPMVLEACAGG
jgi:two-component system, chemotaxis family, protein-glutamate methylesterase/glutaminase